MIFPVPSHATDGSQTDAWLSESHEGQLSCDVFRDEQFLVIRSTMAGVSPEDVDVAIDGDLLTIRGHRHAPEMIRDDDWFLHECYWGDFSRSIVLPIDVLQERAAASLKNGLLEIRLPIRGSSRSIPVRWEEDATTQP